jgi:hypothetical protein
MRTLLTLLAGWMLLVLCGCHAPLFKNPVGDPKNVRADASLSGFWTFDDHERTIFLHLTPWKDGWVEMIMTDNGSKGSSVFIFRGFPVKVGTKFYLNLKQVDIQSDGLLKQKHSEQKEWLLIRYEVDQKSNELKIWLMDNSAIRTAIKDEHIKGEFKNDEAVITESTENLVKILLDEKSEWLKGEPAILKKVELVPVEAKPSIEEKKSE